MANETALLEVFQELHLECSPADRSILRLAVRQYASGPWRGADYIEQHLRESPQVVNDIIAFKRDETEDIRSAELTLWETPNGCYVSNILPMEGQTWLNIHCYNNILNDFIERVIFPAQRTVKFNADLNPRNQSISDWSSDEAASCLRDFLGTFNWENVLDHPLDEEKWRRFIVAVHTSRGMLDGHLLRRWLVEVEKLSPKIASNLARHYGHARDLLKMYDGPAQYYH